MKKKKTKKSEHINVYVEKHRHLGDCLFVNPPIKLIFERTHKSTFEPIYQIEDPKLNQIFSNLWNNVKKEINLSYLNWMQIEFYDKEQER